MSNNIHYYFPRIAEGKIRRALTESPVVVVTGPRQCGKSTLARRIASELDGFQYLDLERPRDLNRLQDAERYFAEHAKALICLDEIQRVPELFPLLRSVVDERKRNGQFLLLGSASPELLRQSSESLAGRVRHVEMSPLLWMEIPGRRKVRLMDFWLRGGFPRSLLAASDETSFSWRTDYMAALLERDLPLFGYRIPPATLRRLWTMVAHFQGDLLNLSKIASSLGCNHVTVRNHLDALAKLYMVHELPPLEANVKKRLIKTPKVYVRDPGLLHALLDLETKDDLMGHPAFGASWEGLVVSHVRACLPEWRSSFYRTSNGAEIDLVLERGRKRVAIECKASSTPQVSRGFWTALDDLSIQHAWVVAPVEDSYPISDRVRVAPLHEALASIT